MTIFRNNWASVPVLFLGLISFSLAQDKGKPAGNNQSAVEKHAALAAAQARVVGMVEDMMSKFEGIASVLDKTNPEQAVRVRQALEDTEQNLTKPRMKSIEKLLRQGKIQQAHKEQDKLLADLQSIIARLAAEMDMDSDLAKLRDLEESKKQLEELEKKQLEQERKNRALAEQQRKLEKLDKQIADMDKIIDKQSEIKKGLEKKPGKNDLEQLAKQQRENMKSTEEFHQESGGKQEARDLAKSAEKQQKAAQQMKNGDAKAAKKNTEQALDKMKQAKQSMQARSEAMDKAMQAGDADDKLKKQNEDLKEQMAQLDALMKEQEKIKDALDQPLNQSAAKELAKRQEQNAQKTKELGKKLDQQMQKKPEAKALQNAMAQQSKATENMESGDPETAEENAQQALEQLEQAQAAMKARRKALAKKMDPEKVAKEQEEIEREVEELKKKIDRSQRENEQRDDPSKELEEAQKKMKQAAGKARRGDRRRDSGESSSGEEEKKDEKASEDLKEAKEKLEERITQYRDRLNRQLKLKLHTELLSMLNTQVPITEQTFGLHQQRVKGAKSVEKAPPLTRAQSVVLKELVTRQHEMFERAANLAPLVQDEGTSNMLPVLMQQLVLDLERATQKLKAEQTGEITHNIQKVIEQTLEDLVTLTKSDPPQSGDQQENFNNNPGLDNSAEALQKKMKEVKAIRDIQQRLYESTREFDKKMADANQPLSPVNQLRRDRLEAQQKRLQRMVTELYEKQ